MTGPERLEVCPGGDEERPANEVIPCGGDRIVAVRTLAGIDERGFLVEEIVELVLLSFELFHDLFLTFVLLQ